MKIKSLYLNNIRSYTDQKIEFPTSTTLLSGDIGSGKSSILLALEFALFGISRGELSGESLLRKGTNQGFVELNFLLDNNNYIIRRTLKNSSNSVAQGNGHIIINNSKEDATPIELKSRMLEILSYPQDSLAKKSLLYRYTVYTPQEEMKRILFDDKQLRLDTLRKVFNIDKYKLIQENCALYTKILRNDIKVMKARTEDLPKKRLDLDNMKKHLVEHNVKLNHILPELERLSINLNLQKEKLRQLEQRSELRKTLVHDIQFLKQKLHSDQERKTRLENELEQTSLQIEELKQKAGQIIVQEDSLSLSGEKYSSQSLREKLSKIDNEFVQFSKKVSILETQKQFIQKNASSILNLNACSVCKQEVNSYHKENVKIEANNQILKLNAEIKELSAHLGGLEFEKNNVKFNLDEQTKIEHETKLKIQQKEFLTKQINEKAIRLTQINNEYTSLNSGFEELRIKIGVGESKLSEIPEIDLSQEKVAVETLTNSTHKKEIEKFGVEKEIQTISSRVNEIQNEISEKEEIETNINNIKKYHDWLQDLFTPLMVNMEKHVFSQVHHEFNSLFQDWFNILLEDESVSTRLDDEFSPLVIQNGYEIDVSDLSGGEKTSVALAYRLALNKVITNLMSNVKTKDLLILDEPTDGFSTDQLDKVRLVLDELNSGQVIIVSHENKIESFVDNVIRITKDEHVSRVG